jgi:hypothetical protein
MTWFSMMVNIVDDQMAITFMTKVIDSLIPYACSCLIIQDHES